MTLQKFDLIIIVVPMFILFSFFIWRYFRRSHRYINEYWFLVTSRSAYLSNLFLLLAYLSLAFALLDLRGAEEKVTAEVPDQKTIILIDSSLSMLTEDVRPNRFMKAIQVARHLVKNSSANQFSIFIFADTYQRIIPFTDDIDLVDSRLAALESLATVKGSSNIAFTLKGMVSYFQSDDGENAMGNILLLTDGEEQEKDEAINLPKGVSLAVVGIGTAKGGQIPIRWKDGSLKGFKSESGVPVVSKLNEQYIKGLGKQINDFDYWIVNSFNLPTTEIIDFFRTKYVSGGSLGEVRTRKAYGQYPMSIFVLLYIISVLLSRFKTFKSITSFTFVLLTASLWIAPINTKAKENQSKQISKETLDSLEKIKAGKATRGEVLKTAEMLLKEGFPESASRLYSEHVEVKNSVEVDNNFATSLVQTNNLSAGIKLYKNILDRQDLSEEQRKAVRKNLITAILKKSSNKNSDDQKKNDGKQNEQNQSKEESGDSNKNGSNSDTSDNKNSKDNSSSSDRKGQTGSKEEKDLRDLMNKEKKDQSSKGKNDRSREDQSDNQNKAKDNSSKKEEGQAKREDNTETFEEREKRKRLQKRMRKTPAILQQTLDLDRDLQRKFLDASKEKIDDKNVDTRPSKDW